MHIRVMWDDEQEVWKSTSSYRAAQSQVTASDDSDLVQRPKHAFFKMLVRQSESRYVLNWQIIERFKIRSTVVARAEFSLESLCQNASNTGEPRSLSIPLFKVVDHQLKLSMDDSMVKLHNPAPVGVRFGTLYISVSSRSQEHVFNWFWNSFTHIILQSPLSSSQLMRPRSPSSGSSPSSSYMKSGSPTSSPTSPRSPPSAIHAPAAAWHSSSPITTILANSPTNPSNASLSINSSTLPHLQNEGIINSELSFEDEFVSHPHGSPEFAFVGSSSPSKASSLLDGDHLNQVVLTADTIKEMILTLGIETSDEDFENMCDFLNLHRPDVPKSPVSHERASSSSGNASSSSIPTPQISSTDEQQPTKHREDLRHFIPADEFLSHLVRIQPLRRPVPSNNDDSMMFDNMDEPCAASSSQTVEELPNIVAQIFLGPFVDQNEYIWETALVNDYRQMMHIVVDQKLHANPLLLQTNDPIYDPNPRSSNLVISPSPSPSSLVTTSNPQQSSSSSSTALPGAGLLRSSISSAYGFWSRFSGRRHSNPPTTGLSSQERRKDVIFVQDRATGKVVEEKMPEYLRQMLRGIYSNPTGRGLVHQYLSKSLLRRLTFNQAKKYTSPSSVSEIPIFIKFHNIDVTEILEPIEHFANFNEFFIRKLKVGARPIYEPEEPTFAISPADCRLHVYESLGEAQRLWIKGKTFNLHSLLDDPLLEADFAGCSLVIARLAPQDYHRFHYPVGGFSGQYMTQGDAYFTVNPIAIRENVDVYSLNKRTSVIVDSPDFGKVMIICVGATMVGSVVLTSGENVWVRKGDELGYFAFGGSTLLVLFQRNRIVFDTDLVLNSGKQQETLVKMGASLGRATRPAPKQSTSA